MKLNGFKVSLFLSVLLMSVAVLPVQPVLASIDKDNWVPPVLNEEPMTFTDIDETHSNYDAVKYLFERGYVEGYEDNTYRPDNLIVRAEFIKILVEAAGETPDEALYHDCFSDVGTEWYAKYVCRAKELGWVQGYPDGTFKPGQNVNNVEALKMALNTSGMSHVVRSVVEGEEWYVPYVEAGYEGGLIDDCEGACPFVPGDLSTRGEVSEYMYKAYVWWWSLV